MKFPGACRIILILSIVLDAGQTAAQDPVWNSLQAPVTASFRGLSVPDDHVFWVGGSSGWIGRSVNGGKDWTFGQVKGFEKFDFRSLFAFDAHTAVIANAGSPAHILRTNDDGQSWKVVYTNEDKEAFFDGIDFWNDREGVAYGDPIQGKMLLVQSSDGGLTWQELPDESRPTLEAGEASFAASGSGIRCRGKKDLIIATGGKVSRLFISRDKGLSWNISHPPIVQGKSSTGIFSVACQDENNWIIVGGDFEIDTLKTDHVFYTSNAGKTWSAPVRPTRGYREAVEFITPKVAIAVGKQADISYDGGNNWAPLADDRAFHTIRKSRKGSLMVMTGGKGEIRIGRWGK